MSGAVAEPSGSASQNVQAASSSAADDALEHKILRGGPERQEIHKPAPPKPEPEPQPEPEPEPTREPEPEPTRKATPKPEPTQEPTPEQPSERPPAPDDKPRPDGFPDESTTGVPAGVSLKPTGSMTISKAGTVIDGYDIRGCLVIAADNVTVRRSRISCSNEDGAVVKVSDARNAVLEDVEIDGKGVAGNGVASSNVTVRRANIHSTVDGIRAGRNTLIEDSYIHHLSRYGDSHNDAIQTVNGSNIVIRHNNLQAYNPETGDPLNAAYMFGPSLGPVSDIQFYGNLVNGGNYSINGGGDVRNVVFRDNVFQRDARYGPVRVEGPVNFDGSNVWADTGESVR